MDELALSSAKSAGSASYPGIDASEKLVLADLANLDRRLVKATRGIKLLSSLSWPATVQRAFLAHWAKGRIRLPEVRYPTFQFDTVRAEIAEIKRQAKNYGEHPVAEYVWSTAESFDVATYLLDAVNTHHITEHSVRLFGKPGDTLPGSEFHNIDAAQHFISIATELSRELEEEPGGDLSAEELKEDLERALSQVFTRHTIRIQIDPNLIAKAAAGPTRIRLRSATNFSVYDRHQLLEHEAFVHSLTALNGRSQKNLPSFGLNSPRITASQEGLATFAEVITGSIDIGRMKRISLRIIAIDMALKGADFVDVFKYFLQSGQSEADSFASAMRVFRGAPVTGGSAFTKDTVYLHGMLSVHTFFRWALKNQRLKLCRSLFAGKMTLQDVITLEPYFDAGWIDPPMYIPHWVLRANGLAGMLAFSLFANRIRLDRVSVNDLMLGL